MKRYIFSGILAMLAFSACNSDSAHSGAKTAQHQALLSLSAEPDPGLRYENLRLYPVLAASTQPEANAGLQHLKTLSEAMRTNGFRVLEQKRFGRSDEAWYHAVTIQNKTQDTVLLLSGDVVKGGNQDRVIAHHEVIMPMSVRNIEVFCVEAGRSSYYNPLASAAEKEAAAFKGYYNIASPKVRRAIQTTGNQQDVWDAVDHVTKANQAESGTKAYTALDQENEAKKRRDTYLNHLEHAFEANPDAVGVVAVCGDQVLGIDIFGNADLFRRHYAALLHGYVAEAAVAPNAEELALQQVQQAFDQVSRLAAPHAKSDEWGGKFAWEGSWVHLFKK